MNYLQFAYSPLKCVIKLHGLQMWRVAVNILDKQLRTADKVWSSSLGVSVWAIKSSP